MPTDPEAGQSEAGPLITPLSEIDKLPTPAQDLLVLSSDELDEDVISSRLASMSPLQALAAMRTLITEGKLEKASLARTALELALDTAKHDLDRVQAIVEEQLRKHGRVDGASSGPDLWNNVTEEDLAATLRLQATAAEPDASAPIGDFELVQTAACLHRYLRLLDTWSIMVPNRSEAPGLGPKDDIEVTKATSTAIDESAESAVEIDDDPWAGGDNASDDVLEIDDPWAEAETPAVEQASVTDDRSSAPGPSRLGDGSAADAVDHEMEDEDIPFTVSDFLARPLVYSALELAASASLHRLHVLFERHSDTLWSYRFAVLENLPAWVNPGDLDREKLLPGPGADGQEARPKRSALRSLFQVFEPDQDTGDSDSITARTEPLSASDLSEWYRSHILALDACGQIDLQLTWVQHAASHAVPDLDQTGEDLSLLSRLIYDSNLSVAEQTKWTLSTWQVASSSEIVAAYLSGSTASTVVGDLRRLVMPYLYVLEARTERSGKPDLTLVDRYLHEAVLSLPLHVALPVFEASKATLAKSDRVIKDDMAVARLALACLYGSDQRDVWATMSAIFECLPVWDLNSSNAEDDAELTSTTLDSIATFVRPTVAQPRPPKAKDLYVFFKPLPFASLSRALDILDVHLESGEALARWDVPVQPRFLLQSARDAREQAELAEKMVRRAAAGSTGLSKARFAPSAVGAQAEEMRWGRLWDDMVRLNGGGDALLRGAFGMIAGEELTRIYLGGMLRSGKFDIARNMVKRLEESHGLTQAALEDVVLATSRELYENAENGNIHTGEMKLAHDCLSVAAPSPLILAERHFIEATSRLTSFSIPSPRTRSALTPVEIRHTKNKLDLIALLLKHSKDAYKHDELVLDLVDKLGCGSDPAIVAAESSSATTSERSREARKAGALREARGEVMGMMAEAAMRDAEWEIAGRWVEEVVRLAREKRKGHKRQASRAHIQHRRAASMSAGPSGYAGGVKSAAESTTRLEGIAWRTSLALGGETEYADIPRRLTLLGWAVELAPAPEVPSVLTTWRKVEDGAHKLSTAAKRRRLAGIGIRSSSSVRGSQAGSTTSTPRTSLDDNARPSLSGALGHALGDVGARAAAVSTTIGPDGEKRVLGSRTAAKAARMALDLGGRWRSGTGSPLLAGQSVLSSAAAHLPSALSTGASRGHDASQSSAAPSIAGSAGISGSGRSTPLFGGWRSGGLGGHERRDSTTSRASEAASDDGSERFVPPGLGMDDAERVRRGARRALVKGVGWLLGAEEGEIS